MVFIQTHHSKGKWQAGCTMKPKRQKIGGDKMLCPDCKSEMEEEAGYSEEEDEIYASFSCTKCTTVFDGWLFRDDQL
jgi:uncharacterized protein with PIN domain